MRRKHIAVVAVILGFACLASHSSANLLVNPGFEGSITGWEAGSSNSCGAWHWVNHPEALAGSNLVAIGAWDLGGHGQWLQTVDDVSQGETFDFSVYAKTESAFAGTVYLRTDYLDASETTLLSVTNSGISGEFTDWQQLSFSPAAAPAGTVEADFIIYVEGTANSAMFDDAEVVSTVIPEPSSFSLTAAALLAGFGVCRRSRMKRKS